MSPRPKIWPSFTRTPCQIPKIYSLSMNLWYLKCKKQLFESSYILPICHYGMLKNMQKWIFLKFRPKYPKYTWDPKNLFLVNLKQEWLATFRSHSLLVKYYAPWNNWAQIKFQKICGGSFRQLSLAKYVSLQY